MKQKKTILIDLSKLKHRHTGIGEVSYYYATTLADCINKTSNFPFEFTFLVPKIWVGKFGNNVKYETLNFFRRHFPFINKHYDIWHAIHQDSAYMPASKKTKYILTVLDLFGTKRLNETYQKILKAKVVATISDYTKFEIIKKWNYKLPITTAHIGVSNLTSLNAIKPAGIKEGENFYFHISSLMPKKNVTALLLLMKKMPESKMVIVGNWQNRFGLKISEEIENLALHNIIKLSNITDAEKAWCYANCSAFMFPSFLEGFGLPVIEAMHFGKPVFISTFSSLPEIGGKAAFYFENFDADYMKTVVDEKMYIVKNDKSFVEKQQKHAATFTWQNNVAVYLKIYESV